MANTLCVVRNSYMRFAFFGNCRSNTICFDKHSKLYLLITSRRILSHNVFVFKKKCESATPVDGVIANWEAGFFRYTGAVIVNVDDKEYSTSAYFSNEEAKEMVGKTVSYAIISDTLFIYEVKENKE